MFTLTLDNASVNDKAAKDLRDTLGAEMFLRAGDFHVRCAAHVLNIMVQDGLKVVVHAIGRVRDIVKTVTSSPSRMQIFNSVVERLGLKTKSGLVLDVPHRWNATYDMIHEALEYKIALIDMLLSNTMKLQLREIGQRLKLFMGFCRLLVMPQRHFQQIDTPRHTSF